MDMQAVKSAADKAKAMASGDMTEKHVFALLAFEDKAGTKEKFDRQFGAGAADRILAEVRRPALPTAVQPVDPVPVCVTVHLESPPPAPVTVNVPEQVNQAAPQVIVQRVDDERLEALERQIEALKKPRKIRVTERDVNGNIMQLEQVAE